ncbi:MAG: hypothetical protein AB8G99_11125 [Planctomycetaceae bacterium]
MRYFLIVGVSMLFVASDGVALAGKGKKNTSSRAQKSKKESRSKKGAGGQCQSKQSDMPPVCGANKDCPCQSYPHCCDGSGGGEGIDIDSLTPEAQSKKLFSQYQARIKFELPEDAGVYLLDQPMTTPGEKRSFVIPVYSQEKTYKYEIKVDVVRNGKKYFKRVKIKEFRAGMILKVAVEAPKVEKGKPIVLKVTPEVEAPGGPPKKDKKDDADGDDADSDSEESEEGDDEIKTTQVPANPILPNRRL